MTDIVKRLRTSIRVGAYHGSPYERGICGRQMTEAADEIERLTRKLDEARADHANIVGAYEGEIERLRASERSAWNAAVERDEQIERLRAEVKSYQKREVVLFSGHEVFLALTEEARPRTSAENVADTLDAVVMLRRKIAAAVAKESSHG